MVKADQIIGQSADCFRHNFYMSWRKSGGINLPAATEMSVLCDCYSTKTPLRVADDAPVGKSGPCLMGSLRSVDKPFTRRPNVWRGIISPGKLPPSLELFIESMRHVAVSLD